MGRPLKGLPQISFLASSSSWSREASYSVLEDFEEGALHREPGERGALLRGPTGPHATKLLAPRARDAKHGASELLI